MRLRACCILMLSLTLASTAAVSAEAYQLDIPAQPLAKALQSFATQSGLSVVHYAEATDARMAPALEGTFTSEEALTRLLQGSDLQFTYVNERTIEIRPATQAQHAGAARISDARSGGAVILAQVSAKETAFAGRESDEKARQAIKDSAGVETITVFGTLEDLASVGSKTGLSLRETPKSITIINRERIEAQNLTTIAGVMKQATGITVRDFGPIGGWFFSRGYRVLTSQVDGGAPITEGFGHISSPDSAMFESVEVLRGVDGLFSGAGDPGGVINLVRKRASSTPGIQLNTSAGRWDNYRAELDVTGPLARDGRVRGRAVGVYEDRGYYWDRASSEKILFYGVLESDVGAATVLSLGGSFERGRHNANDLSGLPFFQDGRSLGLHRGANFAADWSDRDITTKEIFAKMEHRFANDIVFKMNVARQEQDNESTELYVRGPVDPVTMIVPGGADTGASGTAAERRPTRTVFDMFVNGKFRLLSREHSFAVGADYSQMSGDGARSYNLNDYLSSNRPAVDVFNFDPAAFPPSARTLSRVIVADRQTQLGMYATLGLQLADPLRLIVGARYSDYKVKSETYSANASGVLNTQVSYGANYSDTVLVPSFALTYELSPSWRMYASYAQSFKPQANLLLPPVPGTPMDAITGEGYELGIKGIVFEDLNIALSAYRVLRSGEGVRDPAYPSTPGELGASCCFSAIGDVTTKGVDVEFSGRILPGWQLFAGYTFSKREGSEAAPLAATTLYFNWTPEHLFKTWTTWNLPGPLSKWTLNAGVQVQTKISGYTFPAAWPGLGFPRQGGYAVWNASVQYRANENWSAALYAENLFDKTYYEAISTVRSEGLYGVPRNLILRVQYKF